MSTNYREWIRDLVSLRPICNFRFLRCVWIAYAAVEIIQFLILFFGTLQNYSSGNTLFWLLGPMIWSLMRIALVQIFLEMAARILVVPDGARLPN